MNLCTMLSTIRLIKSHIGNHYHYHNHHRRIKMKNIEETGGIYYTTQHIMKMFDWSRTTVDRKKKEGFLPPPDLKGRPDKWLKSKINAIIEQQESP